MIRQVFRLPYTIPIHDWDLYHSVESVVQLFSIQFRRQTLKERVNPLHPCDFKRNVNIVVFLQGLPALFWMLLFQDLDQTISARHANYAKLKYPPVLRLEQTVYVPTESGMGNIDCCKESIILVLHSWNFPL